ncbi:MAG: hypothetical protein LBM98_13650 [Oscillospiraceae bacterium]|nr:hypothetical protein [Oscillospiraceae bacterium]
MRGQCASRFVGAGFKPALTRAVRLPCHAPCAWCAVQAHRHCEAPVSPRYVQGYRCEAIQCRGRNLRLTYLGCLRQPWIASPRFINYVSQMRWRLRKDGQGFALPCSGALRRDGGRGLRPRTARDTPRR